MKDIKSKKKKKKKKKKKEEESFQSVCNQILPCEQP